MVGRKKIPDQVKILHGTNQPCRMNENKPDYEIVKKLPPAPRWFSKLGKRIYRNLGKELLQKNILTALSIPMFIAYCREISIYLEIEMEFLTMEDRIHNILLIPDSVALGLLYQLVADSLLYPSR